ncbi:MAG: F0F1 ATP synthase subunit gamma [Pseudomonadota bacterium]
MQNNLLQKRRNTLTSFKRILNTFYAISSFKLSNLNKYKIQELEKNTLDLKQHIIIPSAKSHQNSSKNLIIAFFSNKGLCGGYNSNINKKLLEIEKEINNIDYIMVGEKSKKYAKNRNIINTISSKDNQINTNISLIMDIMKEYPLHNISIVYNQYINVLKQKVIMKNFSKQENTTNDINNNTPKNPATNNAIMLNCYINNIIYIAYINARKVEESMRINTTFNAKNNTEDNLKNLELQINKLRKIKTTTAILETINAAEAIKNNFI